MKRHVWLGMEGSGDPGLEMNTTTEKPDSPLLGRAGRVLLDDE